MYQALKLDYPLSSLYPYLTYDVLNVHYNVIYLNYIYMLNNLLNSNNYHYDYLLKDLVNNIDIFPLNIRGEILYYLGAVLNHNLYFYNISNKKNVIPVGKIKIDIDKFFGNYENFKSNFINSANNLKGSGYTFLVYNNGSLMIINTSNEDTPYSHNFIPLICLDLWEHAYYLEYLNDRGSYINNFFNIIDFNKINIYYEKILKNEELEKK